MTSHGTVPVWDIGIRLLHALLALSIATAWILSSDSGSNWHEIAGYVVATVMVLRLTWGSVCGPRSARLSRCLRVQRQLRPYLLRIRDRSERRNLGHNPLGAMMIIALLVTAASTCFTGWLFTTDRFWGYAWLANLHHTLAWTLIVLACLHVLGVVLTSFRQRENLPAAMLTGRKRRRVLAARFRTSC